MNNIDNNIDNNTDDNTDDRKECFICYDNFKKNENIIILNCKHTFHKKCINLSLEYMGKIRYTNSLVCSYCNQKHLEDMSRYSLMKLKKNIRDLTKKKDMD